MNKFYTILFAALCVTAVAEEESVPPVAVDTRPVQYGLRDNPSVLLNSQGWAQFDLSMRGSGYSGAGLSINGLNLKVPYSRHFSAELPIPAYLLSRPEARAGLQNSSGHLSGTAAYTTVPQESHLQASAGAGSREHYAAHLSGQAQGAGGFAEWEKARRIDHDANDLERMLAGAHAQFFADDWMIDLIGGHQQKEFGAQGYYGIPSSVYADEKLEDTMLYAGALRGDPFDSFFRIGGTYRLFDDLYRIPENDFKNDVRSHYGALAVEGRTLEIQHVALNLRGDIEHERVSGDVGTHDRTRGSVLLLPQLNFERMQVAAGLHTVIQSDEAVEWLPQAGIDWFVSDNSTVYASYSETVQQHDYQTLYYNDPYHIGNPSSGLQHSGNSELGFRQFVSASLDWRIAAFQRRIENASDWVKGSVVDTAWSATDLGTLDVRGIESEISFYPSEELELRALYQWVSKDDYDVYSGLYELDYPEHLLTFYGHWRPVQEVMIYAAQTLRYQADNPVRENDDFGADARAGVHYFPHFFPNARLSFSVDNLWGTEFQAVPGLKAPGRTCFAGITIFL